MRRFLYIVFTIAAAHGCASVDPIAEKRASESSPICKESQQCERMWAAARTWIVNNADTKLEIYSTDLMQTANPSVYANALAFSVNKEPSPDGSFKIAARAWCVAPMACTKKPTDYVQSFNDAVNAASNQ